MGVCMTIHTALKPADINELRGPAPRRVVALGTLKLHMSAAQRKFRLGVIEALHGPLLPARICMARLACAVIRAAGKLPAMLVGMAIRAPLKPIDVKPSGRFRPRRRMTQLAAERRMFAAKRKLGLRVVEILRRPIMPVCGRMTTFTGLLELPPVGILVTARASGK